MLTRVLTLVALLQVALAASIHNVHSNKFVPDTQIDPKAFSVINNRTYLFSYFDGYSYQAVSFCESVNLTTLALETPEENADVFNYINQNMPSTFSYWTSGMYVVGDWIWASSGEMANYVNWRTGQPVATDTTLQSCAVFSSTDGKLFDDVGCDYNYYFACEERQC